MLTVSQFKRFMEVIKKLGDRVEREHDQYLRDSQRVEDRSGTTMNGTTGHVTAGGGVDFESLVANGTGAPVKPSSTAENPSSWEDDVWGSIFTSGSTVRAFIFEVWQVLTIWIVTRCTESIFLSSPYSTTDTAGAVSSSDTGAAAISTILPKDLERTQPYCFAAFPNEQECIGVGTRWNTPHTQFFQRLHLPARSCTCLWGATKSAGVDAGHGPLAADVLVVRGHQHPISPSVQRSTKLQHHPTDITATSTHDVGLAPSTLLRRPDVHEQRARAIQARPAAVARDDRDDKTALEGRLGRLRPAGVDYCVRRTASSTISIYSRAPVQEECIYAGSTSTPSAARTLAASTTVSCTGVYAVFSGSC